jgi:hypothetical protein
MNIVSRKDYEVDMPKKQIVIGDPLYFEDYADDQKKLNKLISRIKINKVIKDNMKCFVSVVEIEDEGYESVELRICIAPSANAHVYLQDMKYTSQETTSKAIGVDSATYMIEVDENSCDINTMADGYWGNEEIFFRTINGKKNIDAYLICLTMPDDFDVEETISYVDCFFKNKKEITLKAA